MSVFEYAIEREIAKLLETPTPPKTGPDFVEEVAEMLVEAALLLREAAALARAEMQDARKEDAA